MNELIEVIPNEVDEETGVITEIRYYLDSKITNELAAIQKIIKDAKAREDEIKQTILSEMESKNIIKVDTPYFTISYVAPTQRETLDVKSFKEANPDLYDEYVKFTDVKSSVRIKLK